jgi:gluconate 2-dehydrogenase gamma chain
MKPAGKARRDFLLHSGGAVGALWISAHWPAIVAAAQHAHEAVGSTTPLRFEVLTPSQAREVEAIAAQIIPTDELPGAREAGVVYFIDQALHTFAKDSLPTYKKGLADLNQATSSKYPEAKSFADVSREQQEIVLTEFTAERGPKSAGPRGLGPDDPGDFFETIRMHTLFGFLVDPSGGGNRNYAGWKAIDRDRAHSFSPPFGFYDKDYPGWQPAPPESGKE